jgi:hypothetical protein
LRSDLEEDVVRLVGGLQCARMIVVMVDIL